VREDYLLSDACRGEEFGVAVDGGKRSHDLKRIAEHERAANRYLTLPGSLLAFGGLFGFFVKFRLRKIIPG